MKLTIYACNRCSTRTDEPLPHRLEMRTAGDDKQMVSAADLCDACFQALQITWQPQRKRGRPPGKQNANQGKGGN